MLITPLEQFQVISFFPIQVFCLDFSLTNLLFINLIVLFFCVLIINFISSKDKTLFFLPCNWQNVVESIYGIGYTLLSDNLNLKGEKFFPFISILFIYILLANLIGLVPYSFTITSHLIVTFMLSFSIFIGLNIICINIYRSEMLSLFIPSNTSFGLALLLVPIEFVSYIFKPISLGVRLFANLMAGHTLLKVIVGFSWSMLLIESFLSIFHVVPLLILVILMGLELGVAIIQAYVFTINRICILHF
jgi:F-type H+-transporting ATPase subunit a